MNTVACLGRQSQPRCQMPCSAGSCNAAPGCIGNDDVVEEPKASSGSRFANGPSRGYIAGTRSRIAAWVVVNKGERAAVTPEHRHQDFADRKERLIDGSFRDRIDAKDP